MLKCVEWWRKVWKGVDRRGKVCKEFKRCGNVWRVVECCGMCGKDWKGGKGWTGVRRCGKVWKCVEWSGMVWKGVERYGKVWKGVERCGMVWTGVERCGKGLEGRDRCGQVFSTPS